MAISKQDRNVGITVAIVLVVCIASLIAIGSTFIRLIAPGVQRISEILGAGVRVTTVDYNFAVGPAITSQPISSANSSSTTSSPSNSGLVINAPQVRPLTDLQKSAVGRNANLAVRLLPASSQRTLEVLGHIYIPKLGMYSPILTGSNYVEILTAGVALHPNSQIPNAAEWGVICERSYFAAFDPRSCLFLDELTTNDQIWLIIANTVYKYQITTVLSSVIEESEITNYSLIGKSLRIITSDLNQQEAQILIANPVID